MKRLSVGLLAHVDAGKTTLAESLLYRSGSIRKLGRVDYRDTFLDTDEVERLRGITVFSKQAVLKLKSAYVSLIDTPGHVDFSADMERTLSILDYAILVISAGDLVQSHTKTVWRLLRLYRTPCFIFVNKMDSTLADKDRVLKDIRTKLSNDIVDFSFLSKYYKDDELKPQNWDQDDQEEIAYAHEHLLEAYSSGALKLSDIVESIYSCDIYPVFFGSALKLTGIDEFLYAIDSFTKMKSYPEELAAKVYRISRDEQGLKLSHIKLMGSRLRVRDLIGDEKINQIRVYHGDKYELREEAMPGELIAVSGLSKTYAGMSIGVSADEGRKVQMEPLVSYKLVLPEGVDIRAIYKELEYMYEEEPSLSYRRQETGQIELRLFGDVQIEIIKERFLRKFGIEPEFEKGNVLYKESILEEVEGVGHFEPLRSYAEVHLLIKPAKRGSGISAYIDMRDEGCTINYQKAVINHILEKEHKGVLTGSGLSDVDIVLVDAKADNRHTDGGDFREATYRAIRQGLMKAQSVLLEPYYDFVITVPADTLGRLLNDLSQMEARFESPESDGSFASVSGYAPVSMLGDYPYVLRTFTGGEGTISLSFRGYDICKNQEEIVDNIAYDPEADEGNSPGSIFCKQGAAFYVPWYEVEDFMHLTSVYKRELEEEKIRTVRSGFDEYSASNQELMDIFERTYGKIKSPISNQDDKPKDIVKKEKEYVYKPKPKEKEYILIDAYNVIFSIEELHTLAQSDIKSARDRLTDMLAKYKSFVEADIILVFDAYKVEGQTKKYKEQEGLYVLYTKQAETADRYIERAVDELSKNYKVIVVTSDNTEQIIIRSKGCLLISSREFEEELKRVESLIQDTISLVSDREKSYLSEHIGDRFKI